MFTRNAGSVSWFPSKQEQQAVWAHAETTTLSSWKETSPPRGSSNKRQQRTFWGGGEHWFPMWIFWPDKFRQFSFHGQGGTATTLLQSGRGIDTPYRKSLVIFACDEVVRKHAHPWCIFIEWFFCSSRSVKHGARRVFFACYISGCTFQTKFSSCVRQDRNASTM